MRIKDYLKIFFSTVKIFAAIGVIFMVGVNGFLYSQAYFTVGVSGTSEPSQTGCWAPPTVPVLASPANNYVANSTSSWTANPVMIWDVSTSSCLGATIQYHYQSSHVSNFASLAYDSTWLNSPQIPAPGTPDGIYYWHVQARDQWGHVSDFSPAWLLTVDNHAPSVPLLISPGNNTELNSTSLTQTWQEVFDNMGGEVTYNYESYSDPGLTSSRFTANYTNSANGNGQVVTKHAEGAPNGDVYWRVRAVDARGNVSGWSQVWHFKILNTFPNPTLEPIPATPSAGIVLNEILPNPLGGGTAMPNGEWVELYNNSNSPVDVNHWHITDLNDLHDVEILGTKTNTGGTVVSPHSWLVVYFTGAILNNTGDTVNLYSGAVLPGNLIDSHSYGLTPAGKSIARIPDGSTTWYDPVPTPGGPNELEIPTPAPTPTPVLNLNIEPSSEPIIEVSPTPISTLVPTPTPTPLPSPVPSPSSDPLPAPTPENIPVPSIDPTPTPSATPTV
ncbi:MAG TPA: lamin tail domain-containing protein [Patescibacteria group bacterium]